MIHSEQLKCRICQSTNIETLVEKKVRGSEQAKVNKCHACGYHFLTDVDLGDDFYEEEFDTFMAERAKDNSWVDAKEHHASRLKDAHERLAILEKHIDFSAIESALELGCSSGFVLQALKERFPNMRLAGVEPSHRHREYAVNLGHDVSDSLESHNGKKFDFIFSYFVLEHIMEPESWLHSLQEYANPGCMVAMVVPNGDEAMVSTYPISNYDQFVWQLPHVSYFSERALNTLLERVGVDVKIQHHQRYTLSNHLNWLTGMKPKQSVDYDHLQTVDEVYKEALEKHGIGDTLIGFFRIK